MNPYVLRGQNGVVAAATCLLVSVFHSYWLSSGCRMRQIALDMETFPIKNRIKGSMFPLNVLALTKHLVALHAVV